MHRHILSLAILALALPVHAAAQEAPAGNPWFLESFAGAFHDSYDISPDGARTAAHFGIRIGYDLDPRTRVVGTLGYADSKNVSDPNGLTNHFVYGNTWVLSTIGAEYDLIPGRTRIALGLHAGAGWRRIDTEGRVGSPAPETDAYGGDGFEAIDVLVPTITVRRDLTARAALSLGLQDHMFDVLEGPVDHSPAITLGISLR